MKTLKLKIYYLSVMCLISLNMSCDDDDDDTIIYVYSYEDAQEIIALSLAYDSYGLVANFENTSTDIQTNNECDTLYEESDTESGEFNSSGATTYDYNYSESFIKYCDPELFVDYVLSAQQIIESPRIITTHNVNVDFITTGLEETSEYEVYNGTYNRSGGWETVYSEESYDFTYESEVNDIFLSKETGKIISGISTFTLVQDYSYSDLTYTYQGTVDFINEDEAKVTFDDGSIFYVDINNLSVSN